MTTFEAEHWSKTEEGKQWLLDVINETFWFEKDGTIRRHDEYCVKCKNEWVACVCIEDEDVNRNS